MDKETTKNRKVTEQILLDAVQSLVEKGGFECLGVNAVAAEAGVSKMLIYRYFDSLDGLISAYIRQRDYWINLVPELPGKDGLGYFIKEMFKQQIQVLRSDYTLRRLYRWELSSHNSFTNELRNKREEKGLWLIDAVSRLSNHPQKEIATFATIISTAISYLALMEENCLVYNGICLQEDTGWEQLENGIGQLIDLWIAKQ